MLLRLLTIGAFVCATSATAFSRPKPTATATLPNGKRVDLYRQLLSIEAHSLNLPVGRGPIQHAKIDVVRVQRGVFDFVVTTAHNFKGRMEQIFVVRYNSRNPDPLELILRKKIGARRYLFSRGAAHLQPKESSNRLCSGMTPGYRWTYQPRRKQFALSKSAQTRSMKIGNAGTAMPVLRGSFRRGADNWRVTGADHRWLTASAPVDLLGVTVQTSAKQPAKLQVLLGKARYGFAIAAGDNVTTSAKFPRPQNGACVVVTVRSQGPMSVTELLLQTSQKSSALRLEQQVAAIEAGQSPRATQRALVSYGDGLADAVRARAATASGRAKLNLQLALALVPGDDHGLTERWRQTFSASDLARVAKVLAIRCASIECATYLSIFEQEKNKARRRTLTHALLRTDRQKAKGVLLDLVAKHASAEAERMLRALFSNPSRSDRMQLLAAIEKSPGSRSLWRLARRVAPRDSQFSTMLAQALQADVDYKQNHILLEAAATYPSPQLDSTLTNFLKPTGTSEEIALKRLATKALAASPSGKSRVAGLAADNDPIVRKHAMGVAGSAVREHLVKDPWPFVRIAAAEAAGQNCEPNAEALARAGTNDEDDNVRMTSLLSLLPCRKQQSLQLADKTIRDTSAPPSLRILMFNILDRGDAIHGEAFLSLVGHLRGSAYRDQLSIRVYTHALSWLGRSKHGQAGPLLEKVAADITFPPAQAAALHGLTQHCSKRAVRLGQRGLRSRESVVRIAAQKVLAACQRQPRR